MTKRNITLTVALTVEEKVLLHLQPYMRFEEQFEAPHAVTQVGVATAIGIHRKHVPRAIKKLSEKGFVYERVTHVEDAPRKIKTYWLTRAGLSEARNIKGTVEKRYILFRDLDGKETQLELSKLGKRINDKISLTTAIKHLSKDGVFDYLEFIGSKESESKIGDRKAEGQVPAAIDIYKAALACAWAHGTVTTYEREMLETLRKKLNITRVIHREIEAEITSKISQTPLEKQEIYKAGVRKAWKGGTITPSQSRILKELRETLGLSESEHREIESGIKRDISRVRHGDLELYRTAVEQAWVGDDVSEDKKTMLDSLRKILNITYDEHLKIEAKQRVKQNSS